MTCGRGCSGNWDVRCCCEYNCPAKNSNLQFYRCPMMINTICFHMDNDYELYMCVEEGDFDFLQTYFKIDDKDTIEEIINTYVSGRE